MWHFSLLEVHDIESVNETVKPDPDSDSTPILPPCRSTTLLPIANPVPVPGDSLWVWSCWKITKILSANWRSAPMPWFCSAKTYYCPLVEPMRAYTRAGRAVFDAAVAMYVYSCTSNLRNPAICRARCWARTTSRSWRRFTVRIRITREWVLQSSKKKQ